MPWNLTVFDQSGLIDDHRLKKTTGAPSVDITATGVAVGAEASTLRVLPDWNDENAAYAAQGLTTTNAVVELGDGRYTEANYDAFRDLGTNASDSILTDLHGSTEGDFLWTAFHMHKWVNGIKPTTAAIYLERRNNLADWFINDYYNGAGYTYDKNSQNFDHLYGWGLADYYAETGYGGALTALRNIRSDVSAHFTGTSPGDSAVSVGGSGGRRWARNLRFAARLAEVDPTAANKTWRDKVVDIVIDDPNWDNEYNYYPLVTWPASPQYGLDYSAGDRVQVTYHMGIMMDALFVAWRSLDAEGDTTRADECRQRLIDLATFYLDAPLAASGDTSSPEGYLVRYMGRNVNTNDWVSSSQSGSPTDVYTYPPVNGLVMAYKFTGNDAYLRRAWALYKNWQASDFWDVTSPTPSVPLGEIHHYVDTILASATNYKLLANNKGEIQYTYALFENSGDPQPVGTGLMPSWYPAVDTVLEMESFGSAWDQIPSVVTDPSHYGGSLLTSSITEGQWNHRFDGWNSAALIYKDGLPYIANFGGGHAGYGMNDIVKFGPLYGAGSDTPSYSVEPTYTSAASVEYCLPNGDEGTSQVGQYYSDGKPVPPHSYAGLEGVGSSMWLARPSVKYCSNGGSPYATSPTDRYDFDTETWDAEGSYDWHPGASSGTHSFVYHKTRNRLYWIPKTNDAIYEFNPATGVYTNKSYSGDAKPQQVVAALDHTRNVAVCIHSGDFNVTTAPIVRVDLDTYVGTEIAGGPSGLAIKTSIVYAECIDKFVVPEVGTLKVWFLDPDDWTWTSTVFTLSGTNNPTNDWAGKNRPSYHRFRYVPELNGCVYWGNGTQNMYFYRLA